jgi:hypothetical protein
MSTAPHRGARRSARTPDLGDADEHAKQRAQVAESLTRRPDADEVSHRGVLR